MPEKPLRVVARIHARPETAEEIARLLRELLAPTRREPGCIAYELLRSREDPTAFVFVEEWAGEAALAAHFQTDHIQAALPRVSALTAEPPDIRTYDAIG